MDAGLRGGKRVFWTTGLVKRTYRGATMLRVYVPGGVTITLRGANLGGALVTLCGRTLGGAPDGGGELQAWLVLVERNGVCRQEMCWCDWLVSRFVREEGRC